MSRLTGLPFLPGVLALFNDVMRRLQLHACMRNPSNMWSAQMLYSQLVLFLFGLFPPVPVQLLSLVRLISPLFLTRTKLSPNLLYFKPTNKLSTI